MGGLGFKEILLIALVIFLFFGAKRIPALMKGIGKGIRGFTEEKEGITSGQSENRV